MIDSCRQCEPCQSGDQNYCAGPNSWLATYNGPMTPKGMTEDGSNMYGRDNTFGGYSDVVVVPEDFVLRIPEGLDPKAAAPILCAGVTTFSPMKHWGVKAGDKVAILGFGGLGHMALKLAKGLGAPVGLAWQDAEVVSEETGRPRFEIRGTVAARAESLGVAHVHVSLSHDAGIASAVVVLES